jgi:hypothetical protein
LGDGICDRQFNRPGYQYDGGDCCAATCTKSNCGRVRGVVTSVFDTSNLNAVAFPYCNDREMVPLTIHLNDMISSRDAESVSFEEKYLLVNKAISEAGWRNATPVNPYLALDCNGKNVLTIYIEPTMVHNSETVMVEDGANCSLVVRNTTHEDQGHSNDFYNAEEFVLNDPIWYVNYTVFNGNNETERIEILTQDSREKANVNFRTIPECYFRKLENYVDSVSFYTAFGPSLEAINWLLDDDTGNTQCEDDQFIERYALAKILLTMNGTELLSTEKQCAWPTIICSEGQIFAMKLRDADLKGAVPSEIHLLQNLKDLQLCE